MSAATSPNTSLRWNKKKEQGLMVMMKRNSVVPEQHPSLLLSPILTPTKPQKTTLDVRRRRNSRLSIFVQNDTQNNYVAFAEKVNSSFFSVFQMESSFYQGYMAHQQDDSSTGVLFYLFSLIVFVVPPLVFRLNWIDFPLHWSPLWWTAFPFLLITILAICVHVMFLIGWYCVRHYHIHTPNIVAVSGTIATALYLIARVRQGACEESNASIWDGQDCNPLASSNSIPDDAALYLYSIPIFVMAMMRGVDFRFIIVSHLIGLGAVAYGLALVNGFSSGYTLYYGALFFLADFTFERAFRMHYVHAFLEKKGVVDMSNMKAKHQKEQVEQQINHLRNVMGNVAHDLRTPVAIFKGELETMKEMQVVKANPELFSVVGLLEGMAWSMLSVVNRSLDFVKAQSNIALVPQMTAFSLGVAVKLAFDCVNNLQADRCLTMLPLPEEPWTNICSDRQWLLENVMCLLSNSVKFSPKQAKIELKVTIVVHDGKVVTNPTQTINALTSLAFSGGLLSSNASFAQDHNTLSRSLLIEVADTGIGVPDVDKPSIFKPFQNAERVWGEAGSGGVGLGLFSLANRLDALEGSYGVRDRDDGQSGSIFWFAFPYQPVLAPAAAFPGLEHDDHLSVGFTRSSPVHSRHLPVVVKHAASQLQSSSRSRSHSHSHSRCSPRTRTRSYSRSAPRSRSISRPRTSDGGGWVQKSCSELDTSIKQAISSTFALPAAHNDAAHEHAFIDVVTSAFDHTEHPPAPKAISPTPQHPIATPLAANTRMHIDLLTLVTAVPASINQVLSRSRLQDASRPLESCGDTAAAAAAAAIPTSVKTPQPTLPKRMLFVDDTPSVVKMASRMFRNIGYTVVTAENGQEALEVLMQEFHEQVRVRGDGGVNGGCGGGADSSASVRSPMLATEAPLSVVVTDLQMPVMDGFDLVRRYRAFERAQTDLLLEQGHSASVPPPLLIVASSANDNDQLREMALQGGMNGFIPKPCTPKDLTLLFSQLGRRL